MPTPKSARRVAALLSWLKYTTEDILSFRWLMPRGVICMWSGLRVAIPRGWVECDGSNGSPDLREKFIKGVAAAAAPGGTGGSATHTHGVGTYTMGAPDRTVVAGMGAALAGDNLHIHALSGSSAAGSSEPAYYTLIYIFKL